MTADEGPQEPKLAGEGMRGRLRRCSPLGYLSSLLIGATVAAILCTTLGGPGLTWDEPPGIERQHAMHNWFGKVLGHRENWAEAYTNDGRLLACDCRACAAAALSDARPFSRVGVEMGWPFARRAPDEHPPVYAILSYLTWRSTQRLWGPLRAHRLATAMMFAVMAGVMFQLVRRRLSELAALTAVGALVAQPRLFAHAHLATTDVMMASFWFLAAAAFLYTSETGRRAWMFGVLAGLALMSKVAGGLVIVPLIVWSLLHRRRHALRALLVAIPIIPLVMVVVHPGWWPVLSEPLRPWHGITRWYQALVHYDQRVPVFFLGRVYDYRQTFLPWYNAFFLTATAVPLTLLAASLIGIVASLINLRSAIVKRRSEISDLRSEISESHSERAAQPDGHPVGEQRCAVRARPSALSSLSTWALFNFLTLILLRTFTAMPGHDGLRQMLPAFPFLAVLAGCGVYVVERHSRLRSRRVVAAALAVLILIPAAFQTIWTHPYGLSYYNPLIGGTPGAQRTGMETTYYWDSATGEVMDWLNEHLPPNATLVIAPPPDVRTFDWLQRWGKLRGDVRVVQYEDWWLGDKPANVFVVLQTREGLIHTYRGLERYARSEGVYELVPRGINVRLVAVLAPPQATDL